MTSCIRKLCLLLVSATVITLLQAWVLALVLEIEMTDSYQSGTVTGEGFAWDYWSSSLPGGSLWAIDGTLESPLPKFFDSARSPEDVLPFIDSVRAVVHQPPERDLLARQGAAYGWPWLALQCEYVYRSGVASDTEVIGGIALRGTANDINAPKAIPYMIAWPGFGLDVALYGLVILAFWLSVGVVKRLKERRHIRRGCCFECGYHLHGIAGELCPECGSRIKG